MRETFEGTLHIYKVIRAYESRMAKHLRAHLATKKIKDGLTKYDS